MRIHATTSTARRDHHRGQSAPSGTVCTLTPTTTRTRPLPIDGTTEPQTARAVLYGVLQREGAEHGAHDQIKRSWDAAESIGQLAAEYLTLAKVAQAERWDDLLDCSGLTAKELAEVRESDAYSPLVAAFRDAEARGLDVEATFPRLVAARSLDEADDVAGVLHGRVDRWVEAAGSKRQTATDLIAGLIPRAKGVGDDDMARALRERDEAMEQRAATLAEQAVKNGGRRGSANSADMPADPTARAAWLHEVRVVAAYRDRWGSTRQKRLDTREEVRTIEQVGQLEASAGGCRTGDRSIPPGAPGTGAVPSPRTTRRQAVEQTGVKL